jgi:hypothetical protein
VIYVLAVVLGVVVAVWLRRDRSTRLLVGAAAAIQTAALVEFLTVVYPVNGRFPVHGTVRSSTIRDEVPTSGETCIIGHMLSLGIIGP